MKYRTSALLILLAAALVLLAALWAQAEPTRSLVLRNASGLPATTFQMLDSVVVEASDLAPHSGYEVRIVSADGRTIIDNRLSTDSRGRLAPAIIWYGIGALPCTSMPSAIDSPRSFLDNSHSGHAFTVNISRGRELVRSAGFKVADTSQPIVYAADSRGCPKSGFLIGEQDVWVVGKNFPSNSFVRLWAVRPADEWHDGDRLIDETHQYSSSLPPLIEIGPGEASFQKMVWPRNLTSMGSYEIVAALVTYPFGTYRATATAPARTFSSSRTHSGFVIQRRPHQAEPLEMKIAGSSQSPFTFRSAFLTTENVYVGVDPAVQPSVVGKTADVYIVKDKTDAQWTTDPTLVDVTGYVEKITIAGVCGNCWKTLAWAAPLITGKYDVVLDFDQDGKYTPGVDLIDSLEPAGFTVSDIRVENVSFNYGGSGAITIYDHTKTADITAPEFVSAGNQVRAAAWVKGGSHFVQVAFVAVPSVNQAKIWAISGLGGLNTSAAPVAVSFTGGKGTGIFHVNSPPTAVSKDTFHWDWMYNAGSGAVEMGRTGEHLVYTVLANPQAPQIKPWLAVLDTAAKLAEGNTTEDGATRAIWSDFYNNAGGLYDTVGGAPKYTGSTTAGFNLTKWIANYATKNIGVVNCYDMGKAVVVFANAIGANAEYTYTGPFGYLNLVKPIGRGWTNNPFYSMVGADPNPISPPDASWTNGKRTYFGNHGFTRVAGKIFDGSGGQVDIDSVPDAAPAGNPYALDGHDIWASNYKGRVIDSNPVSTPGNPAPYQFPVY